MFSSLASLIFGSNSADATNNNNNNKPETEKEGGFQNYDGNENKNFIADDQLSIGNTIEVTSRTPSVTGSNPKLTSFVVNSRPGKNKNKGSKNHHRSTKKQISSLLKQHQTNSKNLIDEIDDDEDWVLLEKENNEEELPLTVEPVVQQKTSINEKNHRNQKSHSIHSGHHHHHHRPLKPIQSPSILSVSTYNTIKTNTTAGNTNNVGAACDGGPTQSLYVVSLSNDADDNHLNIQMPPTKLAMEESWFLTPPPCFTSTGPINMEISPFENLLIEHPSMSVYHSIRSAQETTESFVNIDLGLVESQQIVLASSSEQKANRHQQVAQQTPSRTPQHRPCGGHRTDRFTSAQIKQEFLARNTQKSIENQKRQSLCRSAIMRSNKVREICSNGNRPRRSDLQHCRILSRANNNRKC